MQPTKRHVVAFNWKSFLYRKQLLIVYDNGNVEQKPRNKKVNGDAANAYHDVVNVAASNSVGKNSSPRVYTLGCV